MSGVTKTAIFTTVSLGLIVSVTAIADRDRPARDAPRASAEKAAGIQQYVRLHRQAIELADDAVLASAIAISRIKEIAISEGKLAEGAGALRYVADKTRNPVVRRLALLAVSELKLKADDPTEAIKALGEVCLDAPGPGPEGPRRGVCRHGPMGPEHRHGTCPRCGARPCPREREEMERRERREMELRERERMERMRLEGRRRGEMGRMGESVPDALHRRSRELDEKARLIEQRMEELKRWAQELDRRERESPRP